MKKCWNRRNNNKDLKDKFIYHFERLINFESTEQDEAELEEILEYAIHRMIDCSYTFDGITGVTERVRKQRQIVFKGKIWVITNPSEWNEELKPFWAIVTDKRITKQGIWVKMNVDGNVAEGDLFEVL